MGAIAGVLLLPVMAPVWGFRFVLEQLAEEADAVMHDEGRAFGELIELSMRHNTGQLSDAEYTDQEAELLERLSSIRDDRDESLDDDADVDEDASRDVESDMDEAQLYVDEVER